MDKGAFVGAEGSRWGVECLVHERKEKFWKDSWTANCDPSSTPENSSLPLRAQLQTLLALVLSPAHKSRTKKESPPTHVSGNKLADFDPGCGPRSASWTGSSPSPLWKPMDNTLRQSSLNEKALVKFRSPVRNSSTLMGEKKQEGMH